VAELKAEVYAGEDIPKNLRVGCKGRKGLLVYNHFQGLATQTLQRYST